MVAVEERALAIGVGGLAIFEILKAYQASVPPLHVVSKTSPDDDAMWTALVHADVLTGGLTLVAGAWIAYNLRSVTPLALALLVFGFVALWHHRVLNTTSD
jgi:hypothetical protein